ncbi:MAG: HlyD family efflux transporter periplasmic adaptor subunit [Firmicutes bacterium]|nr:HlyD family efflux transporter periplasmic adaptor subunit [Bacillota bacterium]
MSGLREYSFHELKNSKLLFDKRPPSFGRILIVLVSSLLIGATLLAAFSPRTYVVRASGTITSESRINIMNNVGGNIKSIDVEDGERVSEGDTLFTLDDTALQTQIIQLESMVAHYTERAEYTNQIVAFIDGFNLNNPFSMQNPFRPCPIIGESIADFSVNRRSAYTTVENFLHSFRTQEARAARDVEFTQEQLDERKPELMAPHITARENARQEIENSQRNYDHYRRLERTFIVLRWVLGNIGICYTMDSIYDSAVGAFNGGHHVYPVRFRRYGSRSGRRYTIYFPNSPFQNGDYWIRRRATRPAGTFYFIPNNDRSRTNRATTQGPLWDFYRNNSNSPVPGGGSFDIDLAHERFELLRSMAEVRHTEINGLAASENQRVRLTRVDIDHRVSGMNLFDAEDSARRNRLQRSETIAVQQNIRDWRNRVVSFINEFQLPGDTFTAVGTARSWTGPNNLTTHPLFVGRTGSGGAFAPNSAGRSAIDQFIAYVEQRERESDQGQFDQVNFNNWSQQYRVQQYTTIENTRIRVLEHENQLFTHNTNLQQYTIRAGKDGVVHIAAGLTEGMVISPGTLLGNISSEDADYLLFEAMIQTEDRSRIYIGATVEINIAGVMQQDFGTLRSIVRHIDATATTTEDGDSFFRIVVELSYTYLECRHGRRVNIITGMAGEGRVQHDETTWLRWLFSRVTGSLR